MRWPRRSTRARKDGREWRLGTQSDVAWINSGCEAGLSINSAIPLEFAGYATLVVPEEDTGRAENFDLLMKLLAEQSTDECLWLGYLDTGSDDVVFARAPRVTLYVGWPYVLVHAGFEQARTWRRDQTSWRAPGPDLVFPDDRTWLLSRLWDDDWRCLGGTATLIERVLAEPELLGRRVQPGEDATPPGHVAH